MPHRRDHQKERLWRARFAEFSASGLSVREFCRQESITEPTFYSWRKELRRRDAERARSEQSAPENSRLIPVAVVEAKARSEQAVGDHAVEICTPSGFRLRFGRDVNPEMISQLLDVITRASEGGESC